MTTPRHSPRPLIQLGQETTSALDFGSLSELISDLIHDPSFLGRRLCEAIDVLSEHRLHLTFHLPLERLVAPDAVPIKHAGFLYGSLRGTQGCAEPLAAHVARVCDSMIATIEQHLLSQFLITHPDLLPRPMTGRERTVLTLWCDGKSRKTIAADLIISSNTVKTYYQDLHALFGANSLRQVVLISKEAGLFHYQQGVF